MAKKKGNAQAVYNSSGILLTDGDETGLFVDALGRIFVAPAGAIDVTGLTPGRSTVNDTASSTTILAANTARKGATFWNNSSSILYLKMGATATTSDADVPIPSQGFYVLEEFNGQVYKGIIDGIWSSDSTGNVRINELT